MLDMGFRPAVDRIVAKCPSARQTLFFSATLEGEAGKVAHEYTSDAVKHSHAPSQRKIDSIEHRFVKVERDDRMKELVRSLRAEDRGPTLVFVRTKRGADRLVKRLAGSDIDAVAMHGDKSQAQREKALGRFKSGKADTLVATDVAARGIDVSGISHVINFDPPEDSDTYVHRTGRTGRAGATGVGITFFGGEQGSDIKKMAKALGLAEQFSRSGHTSSDSDPENRGKRRTKPPRGSVRSKQHSSNGNGRPGGKPKRPFEGASASPRGNRRRHPARSSA